MGKRIRVQRRGRGSPTFRAPTHRRVAPTKYPPMEDMEKKAVLRGVLEKFLHDPGRGSPIAKVRLEDGSVYYSVVSEGVSTGQHIEIGSSAPARVGNVLPLGQIPAGSIVSNIEFLPGDGGKLVRSSGAYATVVAHTPEGTQLKLPSGKTVYVNQLCRATIGVISGGGRTEKPFLKAGAKAKWMEAKGRVYPVTKGVAMIAAVHPHGGGRHRSSSLKPTTVSRGAPPGQKVGIIAARQTGKRKRR